MSAVPFPDPDPGPEPGPGPGPGPGPRPDGGLSGPQPDLITDGGWTADEAAPPSAADDQDADAYLSWFLATLITPPAEDGQGRDAVADALSPGPLLAALVEQAVAEPGALDGDELLAMVSAARRLAARARYLELSAVAEFTRRARSLYGASVAAGDRPGRRRGEFAVTELAFELTATDHAAADRMDLAAALSTRLPATFAGLGDGTVDADKASAIWYYTRFLSGEHAAEADKILAAAAPEKRYDQLARKAARLEIKLDPDGTRARKEHARREGRRVEARREVSGNISFGGRELAVEEGLAAKARNDADAAALRRAGMGGSLRELRVMALLDRIAGRNPLDRLTSPNDTSPASPDGDTSPGGDGAGTGGSTGHHDSPGKDNADPASTGTPGDGLPDGTAGEHDNGEDYEDNEHESGLGRGPASDPGPVPALINLLVPAGTLIGWSTAPGDAGSWGLLDPDDARTLVAAASQHPATRWCITVVGPDGTAVAHGCARGPHPWTPPPPQHPQHPPPAAPGTAGPDPGQRQQLAALLRELNVTLSPIAAGTCDHRHREDRYVPSRKLRHLTRARTATCPAPGCGASAVHCDLDHTIAYPAGPSCECNISPPCRRHHRVKQAPGWKLEQPEPGVMVWTTPSGRVHTTRPTVYDM